MSHTEVVSKEARLEGIDQVHFKLAPETWNIFCQMLEQPARSIPALQSLFQTTGLLDE